MSGARSIRAEGVPAPVPGLFSNAVLRNGILHVSGMHAGGAGDVSAAALDQAREALRRVVALVEAAGGSAADVAAITIYVTDMADRAAVGAARKEVFTTDPLPAATMVAVRGFVDPALKVEIDAVAYIAD